MSYSPNAYYREFSVKIVVSKFNIAEKLIWLIPQVRIEPTNILIIGLFLCSTLFTFKKYSIFMKKKNTTSLDHSYHFFQAWNLKKILFTYLVKDFENSRSLSITKLEIYLEIYLKNDIFASHLLTTSSWMMSLAIHWKHECIWSCNWYGKFKLFCK